MCKINVIFIFVLLIISNDDLLVVLRLANFVIFVFFTRNLICFSNKFVYSNKKTNLIFNKIIKLNCKISR